MHYYSVRACDDDVDSGRVRFVTAQSLCASLRCDKASPDKTTSTSAATQPRLQFATIDRSVSSVYTPVSLAVIFEFNW